jgi:hypothetical protein
VERDLGVKPSQLTNSNAISKLVRPMSHEGELPAGESDYDLGIPGSHRLWGAPDVVWDAEANTLGKSAPPLVMTGLRPNFDMASIGKHLAGCGFTSKKVDGVSVYSGSLTNVDQCAGPFGNQVPIHTSYGLDTEAHTVLMSGSPDAIAAALAAHRANRTSHEVDDLLGQLDGQPGIALGVGPAFCAQMADPATFAGNLATPQQIEAVKKAYSPAKPYVAFGYGLTLKPNAETGRIVFEYPDAGSAKAEAGDRARRLESGQSFVAQVPYSQLVRVVSGHASGTNVVLQVGQPAGRPLDLTLMFVRSDLGFAICG